MSYWDSVGRWINTLLLFIVGVIAFDTLFRLLEAQESNLIVGLVRLLATLVLVPFHGMFSEQRFEMTALMGILGYCVVAALALAFLRSLQATVRPPRQREHVPQPQARVRVERVGRPDGRRDRPRSPARPADAPQPTSAQRAVTRRTAQRPEPQRKPVPVTRPPTRTPTAPRATTTRAGSDSAERSGRPAAGDDRLERSAPKADDTTEKAADARAATPAGARATAETTAPRDAGARDGDGSDDRSR